MISIINKKMVRLNRQTRQKEALYDEIQKIKSFFTAEDLLKRVNSKNQNIGIATIYRFLKYLTQKEKIHSYLCQGRTIYSKDKKAHCHFTCELCGETTHFDVKNINFLDKSLKGSVCHFQIDVSGICEKCIKKKK